MQAQAQQVAGGRTLPRSLAADWWDLADVTQSVVYACTELKQLYGVSIWNDSRNCAHLLTSMKSQVRPDIPVRFPDADTPRRRS